MPLIPNLPPSLVALIAVAAVALLIGLVVLIAVLLDVPKRKQRKNNRGILSAEEMAKKSLEGDAEKGGVEVAVTILPVDRGLGAGVERVVKPEKCRCKIGKKG